MKPVDTYLKSPPPGYALLVAGPWGSGKSHWWNSYSQGLKAIDRVPITISAAGLRSAEELESALFQASIEDLGSPVFREAGLVVGRALLRCVKVDPNDIKLKADTFSGKTVICIDDIERFAGDFSSLFGFALNLIDRGVVHCILMADETQAEAKFNEAYASYKERLVGRTVHVRPDIDAFCDQVIKGFSDDGLRDSLEAHQDAIVRQLKNKGISNLRTARYFITELAQVLGDTKAAKGADLDSIISAVAFWTMCASKSSKNSSLVAKAFSTTGLDLAMALREQSRQAEDDKPLTEMAALLDLIQSMGFSDDVYNWPQSLHFAKLVKSEEADFEAIAVDFQLREAVVDERSASRILAQLNSYRKISDRELQEAIRDARAYLHSLEEVHLPVVFDFYRLLHYLSEIRLFDVDAEAWTNEVLGILAAYGGQIDALSDARIEFIASPLSEQETRVHVVIERLEGQVESHFWLKQRDAFLHSILTGEGDVPDLVSNGPLFSGVDVVDFHRNLSGAGVSAVTRLGALTRSALRVGNARDFIGSDGSFFRALANEITANIPATNPISILDAQLSLVAKDLVRLADHVK